MTFLIISFIAGVLTVLAPCVLPLLPVIVGSSASGRSRLTPYTVVGALAVSIIIFTYLLKASTVFIMVPPEFWTYLSGGILTIFGLTLLFPALWEHLPGLNKLQISSNKLMGSGYQKQNFWGDVLIGAALGPVFSTCSPTYFVILASVLPVSFLLGTAYLLAYVIGLSIVLLLIALLGQRFADKLTAISDPRHWFKRAIGLLFIILGLMIMTGLEKRLETAILDSGYFDITKIEQTLLQKTDPLTPTSSNNPSNDSPTNTPNSITTPAKKAGIPYNEIVDPSGFVNTEPFALKDLVGNKVILVDFLTYSCINCQRTFPYINAWYDKYKDQGLEIVGIHTPEFAFEHDINNVREAMKKFGITHPIVLDNDYATWRAYGNNFWPRKYLIDIYGNIVYDHIGEGAYEETELKIQELLQERAQVLGTNMPSTNDLAAALLPSQDNAAQSPETYFGAARNERLGNGAPGQVGEQTLSKPALILPNVLYLTGKWSIDPEFAAGSINSSVIYHYSAREVYLVAAADTTTELEIWQDDKLIKTIKIKASQLYTLISNNVPGEHLLELKVKGNGLRFYAFTFG